jgi:hypothetical protein
LDSWVCSFSLFIVELINIKNCSENNDKTQLDPEIEIIGCQNRNDLLIGKSRHEQKKIQIKKVSDKIGQNENCYFISNPYEFEINQKQNWLYSEKLSAHFFLST